MKEKQTGIKYDYYNDPTEIKARLDVLRNLLSEANIYDAGKEAFTMEHLEKLLQRKDILKDYNVAELFMFCISTVEDLLYLMNNIASYDSGLVKREGKTIT